MISGVASGVTSSAFSTSIFFVKSCYGNGMDGDASVSSKSDRMMGYPTLAGVMNKLILSVFVWI